MSARILPSFALSVLAALAAVTLSPEARWSAPVGAQGATLCDREDPSRWGRRPSIEILYFQGACNPRLVPDKEATVRVYLNWEHHPKFAEVPDLDFTIRLTDGNQALNCLGGSTITRTMRRPDLYSALDRKHARNSVNFYGCRLNGVSTINAEVSYPDAAALGNKVTFPGTRKVEHMSKAHSLKATVVFPTVASWAGGVPRSAMAEARLLLDAGRKFALQNYPLSAIEFEYAVLATSEPTGPDDKYELRYEECPNRDTDTPDKCRLFDRRNVPGFGNLEPAEWLHSRLASPSNPRPLTIAVVPSDFDGRFTGIHLSNRKTSPRLFNNTFNVSGRPDWGNGVIVIRNTAWASTVAHEIGHYLGLYHYHDGLPGSHPGIEGFLNDGASSVNKSAVEGNGGGGSNLLRSLMQPMAMPTGLHEQFILNGQYKALVEDIDRHGMPSQAGILRDARTLLALLGDPARRGSAFASPLAGAIVQAAEAQNEGVLVVRGWLASGGAAGILEPVEWQPGATPIQVPVASDLASIRILGSAGQTLAAAPIAASAPGWSLTRSSGDDRTTDNAPLSFSVTLPRVREAQTLQLVSATGTVLEQVAASASPPSVRLVSPASGTPWSPGTPITWHGSDADGDRLTYSVYYSADGHGWIPLALGVARTELAPDALAPGPRPMLAVTATDGVHVGVATVGIRVAAPVTPVFHAPVGDDAAGTFSRIEAAFNTDLSLASVTADSVVVTGADGRRVAGAVRYDESARRMTMTPAAPLRAGAEYTVRIGPGLADRYGNRSTSEMTWTFRVARDTEPPQIEAIEPRDGALAIPLDVRLSVRFSEPMAEAGLSAIVVQGPDGVPVKGTVSYAPDTHTATFVPADALKPRTSYAITVPATIADAGGNALAAPGSSTFTTGIARRR